MSATSRAGDKETLRMVWWSAKSENVYVLRWLLAVRRWMQWSHVERLPFCQEAEGWRGYQVPAWYTEQRARQRCQVRLGYPAFHAPPPFLLFRCAGFYAIVRYNGSCTSSSWPIVPFTPFNRRFWCFVIKRTWAFELCNAGLTRTGLSSCCIVQEGGWLRRYIQRHARISARWNAVVE